MTALSRRGFTSAVLACAAGCERHESARPGPIADTQAPAASSPSPTPPAPPTPALFRAFPRLASNLNVLPLATLPTPLEPARRLGATLGLEVLAKRDDLTSSLHGGGKTRKLAFLLGDALAKGARDVVTFGSVGSNQAVATALHGAALGLRVTLALAPGPHDESTRAKLLAARRAGASLRLVSGGVAQAEAEARRDETRGGPYVIPQGGSSALGNLAFVDAGLELAEQLARRTSMHVPVYVAMGTMGSAVGIAIGLTLAGVPAEVVAVRASGPATSSQARFDAMVRETVAFARRLDPSFPEVAPRVRIEGRQLGGGYARATASGLAAIEQAEREEGWHLEPTYTGKTLAALIADAPRLAGAPVVFWCSHHMAPLVTDGATAADVPPELRRYAAPAK